MTRTLAFTKREFKLATRYKWAFLSVTIVLPMLHVLPLIILYGGLMTFISGIKEVTPDNYLSWVLLGSLLYTVFLKGWQIFRKRFANEKYWMTIYGILIAPVSKYYLLFGVVIELMGEVAVTSGLFLILAFIAFPTMIVNILVVTVIILITLIGACGVSMINGTFYLINENTQLIFDYILYFLVFISTYLIPFELYPSFLQGFIYVNPFYHLINTIRSAWFGLYTIEFFWSFLYIGVFSIVCVIIGVIVFSKLTRRFGVRGY